jgi:hypothetical protein
VLAGAGAHRIASATVTDATELVGPAATRPTGFDPQQLGFTPRKPVPWLGPILLAVTGARVALAEQFGAYLDKRELQNAFPKQVHDHHEGDELWFDFAADLGDGFNATYSIAYLLAQPELEVDGTRLPRGQILVLGGDQVYPTANDHSYEDRFRGPYRAALPAVPAGEQPPTLYALAGNHDWYDGLSAFLRTFARREGTAIGGWCTRQTRSYFALRLPQGWWLLGIDSQEGGYLDDPQLSYFHDVAKMIQPSDKVIVCAPNPTWVQAVERSRDYDTIDYFLRRIITPTGAQVRLLLSGDLHHYSRYSGEQRELITFGGGGAFLAATHPLPPKIMVPPKETIVREASRPREYALAKTYPSKARSRTLASGVFTRLPWRNRGFVALLGVLHTMLLLALDNSARRLVTVPVFLMVAATFGLTFFFAAGLTSGRPKPKNWILGSAHGVIQVGLGVAGLVVWRMLPFDQWDWPWPVVTAAVFYGPVIAVIATEVVALYLLVAGRFMVNINELFAGQGIQGYKGFLRMHIGADGRLTIYPIGVDRVAKRWRTTPEAAPHMPWFEPHERLRPKLIEDPIRL